MPETNTLIYCKKCKDYYAEDHFNKFPYNIRRGLKYTCKTNAKKVSKYQSKNKYAIDSYEYIRDMALRRMYNSSLEEFNALLKSQNNCCKICGISYNGGKKFALDHCHHTLKNRGILCNVCNAAIGRLNDNTSLLKKAIDYLTTPTTEVNKNLVIGYLDGWKRAKQGSLDIITARRRRLLWREYKMSLEDYYRVLDFQNGCCAICEIPQEKLMVKLNVDHDHKTGKVRGLLCPSCNTGIGFLNDDILLINKSIQYLESYVTI